MGKGKHKGPSSRDLVKAILRAQGIYENGDSPEPTAEAIKLVESIGYDNWSKGYSEGLAEESDY